MAGRHARPTRAQARAGAYAQARQPISPRVLATKRRRLRKRAGQAAGASSLLAGSLLVGLVGGGGTFALWNQDLSVTGTAIPIVVPDGEVSLIFAVGDPAESTATFSDLLPGESKTLPVLLQNNGDLDLDVEALLTGTTGAGYSIRLELDESCIASDFLASSSIGGSAVAVNAPLPLGSIAKGAARTLCVEVTADGDIVPSSAMTFDVILTGDSGI